MRGKTKAVFNRDFKEQEKIKAAVDAFENSGRILKEGRNVLKEISIDGKKYVFKSFKKPVFPNNLIYRFFRESKAKRSYDFAHRLLEKGIKTPRPIAFFEFYRGLGLGHSFYISEAVEYDLTFRELIHQPDYPEREKILRQFTHFTFRMHEKQVLFKDHSPGNTLIVKNKGHYDFYLVDLNRMRFVEMDFKTRMKNFARLYPTPDMIDIMSAEYSRLSGKDRESVHGLMTSSFEKFKRKYERKKNITRPLKKMFKKMFL